jgi:hypothetical protein
MRTRARNFFKVTTMLTLMSLLLISCGGENESGNNRNNVNGYNYAGISTAGNGISLPGNWLQIVHNENPCRVNSNFNGQNTSVSGKIRVVVPLQGANINAGAFYAGVTPEGDVGIVSNQGNGPVMEVFLCPRADVSGQGSLMATPVLNTSRECPIGEITAANISLQGQFGYNYNLSFAPINILGTDRRSSLCQGSYQQYPF